MDWLRASKIFIRFFSYLCSGVFRFGKDWKKIDDIIFTRSSTQIRSHAQKYFIKFQKQLKEKKKAKNKGKTGLTELERELATYFKPEDITKETPQEFINFFKSVYCKQ